MGLPYTEFPGGKDHAGARENLHAALLGSGIQTAPAWRLRLWPPLNNPSPPFGGRGGSLRAGTEHWPPAPRALRSDASSLMMSPRSVAWLSSGNSAISPGKTFLSRGIRVSPLLPRGFSPVVTPAANPEPPLQETRHPAAQSRRRRGTAPAPSSHR